MLPGSLLRCFFSAIFSLRRPACDALPELVVLDLKNSFGSYFVTVYSVFFFEHLLLSFLTFFCVLFVFCLPCFLLSPISFSVGPSLLLFMFSHFLLFLHTWSQLVKALKKQKAIGISLISLAIRKYSLRLNWSTSTWKTCPQPQMPSITSDLASSIRNTLPSLNPSSAILSPFEPLSWPSLSALRQEP